MEKHPGGADLLKDNSNGKDASQEYDDADHTKRAREMLNKYYIGDLAEWAWQNSETYQITFSQTGKPIFKVFLNIKRRWTTTVYFISQSTPLY